MAIQNTPIHDFFICHASEDKDAIARPLAEELVARGFDVWYDEFALSVGDGLRSAIQHGLANSRFGVIVLSQSFFAKKWPQEELDGLVAREMVGDERVLLPVWHEIDQAEIVKESPSLADRVAVPSSEGVQRVADRLVEALERRRGQDGGTGAPAAAPTAATGAAKPAVAAEAKVVETPAAVALVEARERVRLGYSEHELTSYAVEGGDPRGPGWLSVIVAPVELQQDLIDPTGVQPSDLRSLDVPGARDNGVLQHFDLRHTLDGFEAQLPPGHELPAYQVRISEDGLMEFGTTLVAALSSGDPERDRTIPTLGVADYINDYARLFLRILDHVGYTGEASVQAIFSGVEGHHLGVEQLRYFWGQHPLEVPEVASRPLRGLVAELPDALPRWLKKTMDRLFLAGGISSGAYFLDDEGTFTK